jgi:hypothetical protein
MHETHTHLIRVITALCFFKHYLLSTHYESIKDTFAILKEEQHTVLQV